LLKIILRMYSDMRIVFVIAAIFLFAANAFAQVKLDGSFVASKSCPAVQSIKKGTNPGNVSVESGKSYVLLGKNKEPASHYWIEVPNASPMQRWVGVECGAANGTVVSAPSQTKVAVGDGKPFYVLALSWEPAFCEGMSDKAECRNATPQSFEASHFALHGLWPQPRRKIFCNVDKALAAADDAHHWEALPEPELSAATKAALDQVMPGTQSMLERHEWTKHGSCYPGGVAETYFGDAIRLMTAINASAVQGFMAANVGKTVQTGDLRAKFDEAFGSGAGERIRVACKLDGGRQLITEITVGLKGDITAGTTLPELIAASSPTDAGCPSGVIDPAGLQ
jgi:ribonuclease T2